MDIKEITKVGSDLAELILTACEKSKTGEISQQKLEKIIYQYLIQYFNGREIR